VQLLGVDVSDRGLSKECKDLEAFHELKGPMTRSKTKLLQEEMAKRTKDGLLIKGKEGGSHKELNWTTLEIFLNVLLSETNSLCSIPFRGNNSLSDTNSLS